AGCPWSAPAPPAGPRASSPTRARAAHRVRRWRRSWSGSAVAVFGAGEAARAHRVDVGAYRAGHRAALGQEILDELRPPVAAVEAEHVVQHQHLAVAVRPGADADGGDWRGAGDLC